MTLKNSVIKEPRQRRYLARDFDSFRSQLVSYARQYFPNSIQDFSESGVGGVLVDLAAYVGDSISFYADHQYQELSLDTAFEEKNIERHLRSAGVPITGASPAVVDETIYIQVPAVQSNGKTIPRTDALPIIKANSQFSSNSGITFNLLEDVDFTKQNSDGSLIATQKIGKTSIAGDILTFVLFAKGTCVSGEEVTETVSIGSDFIPFRKITLSNPNVTQIISVSDSYGNEYYEVSALTDDIVYKNVINYKEDNDVVDEAIKIIPAPYRYISEVSLTTRKSTLTFGGGSAESLEDDIIPDPSDFAIRFPYKRTFSRTAINPQKMLESKTLGVATVSTELKITYRFGGGLSHNAGPNEIQNIDTLITTFPGNPSQIIASQVRSSVEITNETKSVGGEDAMTTDDFKDLLPSIKASQERVVSRPDLLSRIYTMPSNFGRVYRAGVRSNPNNPLATQLFIISRDSDGKLTISSDTLKTNLVKYLNPYRMISDAIDILDAQVINLQIKFEILIDSTLNKSIVLQQVLVRMKEFCRIQNFYIDQPLILSEIRHSILAIRGVVSLNSLVIENLSGNIANVEYSDRTFDINSNTYKDILFPPPGGIFEVKHPEINIIGYAI